MTDRQKAIRNRIIELHKKGLNNNQIAKELGYKHSNSITHYLNELGLKSNAKTGIAIKEKYNKEAYNDLVEQIKEYVRLGWSINKISKEIKDISPDNIKTISKNENIIFNNTHDFKNARIAALNLKEREQIFAEKINKKDKTKAYHHGFTNIDSEVYIKCLDCNNIYKVNAQIIRNKSNTILCKYCLNKAKEYNKQQKDKLKQATKINTERIQKANKLLNSIQITFQVCKQCGVLFIGNTLYCSTRCMNRQHENQHTRARYNKAKQNGTIDYSISLDKLIKRDNNICYICNKECNLNDYTYKGNIFIAGNYYPSIDHIVPLAKGGTHEWSNIKLAHRICNSLKSDKL